MKNLWTLIMILVITISCREKTSYQLALLLENETESAIEVVVYPKSEYLTLEDCYDFSDFGGGCGQTTFGIGPASDYYLYYSKNLDWNPSVLAAEIFDSIHITLPDDDKMIKFSMDTVIGYTENLFDTMTTWKYEVHEYDEPTNFNKNPVESHDYTFVILREKIR